MKNFQDTSLCPVIFKSISLLVLVLKKTFFFLITVTIHWNQASRRALRLTQCFQSSSRQRPTCVLAGTPGFDTWPAHYSGGSDKDIETEKRLAFEVAPATLWGFQGLS